MSEEPKRMKKGALELFLKIYEIKKFLQNDLPDTVFILCLYSSFLKMEDKVTSDLSFYLISPVSTPPSRTFLCGRALSLFVHSVFVDMNHLHGCQMGTRPSLIYGTLGDPRPI